MRVQKSMLLSLAGDSAVVSVALLGLKAAPRIIRMTAEGDRVEINVLPETKSGVPIEFEVQTDAPATSQVIRLPGTEQPLYLTIESTELTDEAAAAIVQALNPVYNNDGFVDGTDHREILAPTPTTVTDRIMLRNADGQKIAEVKLPNITDESPRFTAALIGDKSGKTPVIMLAAENEAQIAYIAVPELVAQTLACAEITIDASNVLELSGSIQRNTRANAADEIDYKLADDTTVTIRLDESSQPKVTKVMSGMQEGDDTAANLPWSCFGTSHAIQDESGAPTSGYANATEDGVSFRFVPQAIPAQEAPQG